MSSKEKRLKSANIADVNKQIFEIKKKIQLSEGQRKALFEIREAEGKTHAEEIAKVKREIGQLMLGLREHRCVSAKNRIKSCRLKAAVGPLVEKPVWETQDLLDLHNIDKTKHLNLIRYRIQQRQNYFTKLANEYQALVSEKRKIEVERKVEVPIKQIIADIQNNIHAVKIQWREAVHVYKRYQDIKKSLLDDSSRFEYNIKCANEELQTQTSEIERLQKTADDASKMRAAARSALLQQEKAALNAAKARDQQETEGRKLVTKGKQNLEKLERRLFQSGKVPVRETDTGEDNQTTIEVITPSPAPEDKIYDMFDTLRHITGSTSNEEVVKHFRSQKETDDRLNRLRNSSEVEKKKLEKKVETLTMELQRYKYAEAKEAEQSLEEVEKFHELIQTQKELEASYQESTDKTEKNVQTVVRSVNGLYLAIHSTAMVEEDHRILLKHMEEMLKEMMAELEDVTEIKTLETERLEIEDEKWLPAPYSGLVRHTPVPQEGASPIPPATASDDEEEVPTRGYLKRQAQLVVDAKSRRKNIRIQRK